MPYHVGGNSETQTLLRKFVSFVDSDNSQQNIESLIRQAIDMDRDKAKYFHSEAVGMILIGVVDWIIRHSKVNISDFIPDVDKAIDIESQCVSILDDDNWCFWPDSLDQFIKHYTYLYPTSKARKYL